MNVNQLRKAIKVAKAESKQIYISTPNNRFHIDSYCKYRIDGVNELLIINDSFLKDTIILDIHQIMFIETNFKH